MHRNQSPEGSLVHVLVRPQMVELWAHSHSKRFMPVSDEHWQTEQPKPNPRYVRKGEDDVAWAFHEPQHMQRFT